ncbi:ribonuclease HIII [Candidatus Protochlamydia naegleriophila]|uniref:Ribonuclease HIII n=1 Tax=Candidatus Protochlamydia naegleriophila TaxID=389348 RepID=A0A0U5JCB6_9BACT|nr:ribonuclease HIII [Candidatus Protochlamydia naegleriophila]CUI17118.1 ribonuclease HIII [Candidatus Protochlamydia naegleriophila]
MTDASPAPFVTTLDLKLADKLLKDLQKQEFAITSPPHTRFSARKKGLTCTLYTSGKLVVQGKEQASFIEFYLEPEILGTFTFTHPLANVHFTPHIGIDESGKGDFFGPLCVAGVYVTSEQFPKLVAMGIKDSKTLNAATIAKLAAQIKSLCLYHIVKINPVKYNEIYESFKNLNRLLAWGHATTIEQLVQRSGCQEVTIDQFADERVVLLALKRKKMEVQLTQRHRAEDDVVVAAASILARQAFVDGLEQMSQEIGITLPKGSSAATLAAGKKVLKNLGIERLLSICKQHFKTLDAILGKERE